MKKLSCIICDHCRKVIAPGLRPISVKSKKGRDLHFCENVTCQSSYTPPKPRQPKPKIDKLFQHLITPDQASQFIDESNLIEQILISRIEALAGWMSERKRNPRIMGNSQWLWKAHRR